MSAAAASACRRLRLALAVSRAPAPRPRAGGCPIGRPLISPEERAAEERAEDLLGSVVGEDALAAYRALGFLHAFGGAEEDGLPGYGYLIYPHRPIVSFDSRSGRAAERALRPLSRPDRGGRARAAARRRRRARQVDGAPRRRARPARRGQHRPSRRPGRPRAGAARHRPPAGVGQPLRQRAPTTASPPSSRPLASREPRPDGSPAPVDCGPMSIRRATANGSAPRRPGFRGPARRRSSTVPTGLPRAPT